MPRIARKLPTYRLHKPSGRAVVTLDARDHYVGQYGTPESRAEYDRLIAEWLSKAHRRPRPDADGPAIADLSINEVLLAFWRHAEQHYRPADGKTSSELANFRDTLRPLRRLYGTTLASNFGPTSLKAVRRSMIESELSRTTINQRVGRIVHVFKWAASEELVPPSVHHGLKTVSGLQKGRTEAKEPEPVRPVPEEWVDAIRPHVPRRVWAMVELQRLTGMRPGEVCSMRTGDLDRTGAVWVYAPSDHKMLYRGRARNIFIGQRAQSVLMPWLRPQPSEYLFNPRESMEELRAEQRRNRKTPLNAKQRARGLVQGARPGGRLNERYGPRSYYHAVQAGCRKAGVPPWHPNQLRHNAATRLRKEFGLDTARAVLGHSSTAVTEIYAELDRDKAAEAMARVG